MIDGRASTGADARASADARSSTSADASASARSREAQPSTALEFRHVDILFAERGGRAGRKAVQSALEQLDRGASRAEVAKSCGVVVGVSDASLAVAEGEISVMMGLSGSGKSTLLRAANGLNAVTRGEVLLRDGDAMVNVVTSGARRLRGLRRRRIAMVFQQFALLPWRTVRENVGLGLELRGESKAERRDSVQSKLELVGLADWADKPVAQLSGGMQQRVGLARAFATEADVLLMDEPFSALDPLIRSKLQQELLALQERVKKTILFVSHDLDEALRIGDTISILQHGQIVQTGAAHDIVLRPADAYVEEFVRHMNPLNVLTGEMVMSALTDLPQGAEGVWLDPARRYRLERGAERAATHVNLDGLAFPVRRFCGSELAGDASAVTAAPAGISLQQIIHLQACTGHPVLLMADGEVRGVCGEREILTALSRRPAAAAP